ncbi:MAG TPA: porphobilinogen synthase [Methanoculleus sp.]|nr:porphobilinogen synthase [Methanoculleus sp.]
MFPERRLRRLRTRALQPLLRETVLTRNDLIAPVFVDETIGSPVPISSMPGQFRHSVGDVADYVRSLHELGIRAVVLFGVPAAKDAEATEAWNPDGIIQRTVRALKNEIPEMVIITDVCACEYTDHGHCGIVGDSPCGPDLLNDPSLELMARIALSHAQAGADMVAPSCMLDGMVMAIREELDCNGYEDIPIMSYSTKFASALYGPFRDAVDSGYSFGDRTTYQMSPANAREAFLESKTDEKECADILMVKPAGMYLDVIAKVATIGLPVAAYQVSGEYAMIKAAAANGWIDEREVMMESLLCIKRAGADLIITYFAEDAARWMMHEE